MTDGPVKNLQLFFDPKMSLLDAGDAKIVTFCKWLIGSNLRKITFSKDNFSSGKVLTSKARGWRRF